MFSQLLYFERRDDCCADFYQVRYNELSYVKSQKNQLNAGTKLFPTLMLPTFCMKQGGGHPVLMRSCYTFPSTETTLVFGKNRRIRIVWDYIFFFPLGERYFRECISS